MGDYDDGQSFLECPVCLESYDRLHHLPKMTSCLHTTCIACIASMLEVSSNYEPSAPIYDTSGNQSIYGDVPRSSSAAAPPLIPQRQATAPRPRPPVVKRPYEIPRNTTFSCPLCRANVNSDSVQTNRYIIAHLKDLSRLTNSSNIGSRPSSSSGRLTRPLGHKGSTSYHQQQKPRVPLLENWCNYCCYPAKKECETHDKIPLTEWTAQKVQTLQERTNLMQVRLRQHEDSLSRSERDVRDVLSALTAVISKVEVQRRDGRRLQGTLKALQEDWQRAGGGAATPTDRVDQLRKKAITVKEQTKLLHDLKNQVARLESGGPSAQNVVMWQSAKKLYVKKGNLTFSIIKEGEDYIP